MAFVYRTYECPDCTRRFELMQERDDGPPRFCLHCGADFGEAEDERPEAIPGTHAIGGSVAAKSVDMTYALLEQQGQRAYEATGNPNLKITNLKDNLREGDVAAMSPPASSNRTAREAAAMGLTAGWHGAGEIMGGMPAGPHYGPANIGLGSVQGEGGKTHAQTFRQMQRAGQINRE